MTEGPSRPALMRENEQLRAEVDRLRSAAVAPVEVVRYLPGEERVVERVVYADNPDHIEMIRQLQARVSELQGVQR